jgi:hypothetical protein
MHGTNYAESSSGASARQGLKQEPDFGPVRLTFNSSSHNIDCMDDRRKIDEDGVGARKWTVSGFEPCARMWARLAMEINRELTATTAWGMGPLH